jgi:hypothetical protein
VSWTWIVEAKPTKGAATVTVKCTLGKKSTTKSKVILVI